MYCVCFCGGDGRAAYCDAGAVGADGRDDDDESDGFTHIMPNTRMPGTLA